MQVNKMKIYIATPVNARSEATIEEKRKAAYQRVLELKGKLMAIYPDAEFHSSFDDDIAPLSKPIELLPESVVMGKCVTCVMECDAILMDWGHVFSKGCGVEQFVASTYGKKIIYPSDLEYCCNNPVTCLCCKHCLPPALRKKGMCELNECKFEKA